MAKVRVNFGRVAEECHVKVYVVHNTSAKHLYVLARDEKTAMSIAWTANHVYSPQQKIADNYSRGVYEMRTPFGELLSTHWDAIQEAASQRWQGTIHFDGDCIAIGDEIFLR